MGRLKRMSISGLEFFNRITCFWASSPSYEPPRDNGYETVNSFCSKRLARRGEITPLTRAHAKRIEDFLPQRSLLASLRYSFVVQTDQRVVFRVEGKFFLPWHDVVKTVVGLLCSGRIRVAHPLELYPYYEMP